jgi:flagellar motility protein MotE (MotC chaperone)
MQTNHHTPKSSSRGIQRLLSPVRTRYARHKRLFFLSLILLAVLLLVGTVGNGALSLFTRQSTIPGVESAAAGSQTVEAPVTEGTETQGEKKPDSPAQSPTLSASDIPLLKSLEERKAQLDQREQQLVVREKELQTLQQRLEDKIATLALLRRELEDLMREKEAFEEKRLEHLVKIYSGMKPEEAAPLIERLHEDTAVKVFYQMKEKKVGQILAFIKPEIAAKISERLAIQQQKNPTAKKENL